MTRSRTITQMFDDTGRPGETLTIDKDGLLVHSKQMVVPHALHRKTLEKIHTGHQGIQRCLERAKTSVWWSGILKEVEKTVRECRICTRKAAEKTAPMIASELPNYPWQKIGTDTFQFKGVTYLLMVDYLLTLHRTPQTEDNKQQ